jgi:SAM-dependent methyltransferase
VGAGAARRAVRLSGSVLANDGEDERLPTAMSTDPAPTPVPLDSAELHRTTATTLRHYNQRAQAFWHGTRCHDVSQNVAALLRHLPGRGPHTLLDFGCGPGRDLVTFRDLGYESVGLDGSEEFVRMARSHSSCEVLHQDFLSLSLRPERFHGIFANASLFHVPSQELPQVLGKLQASLKTGGVLFSSNPHGPNREGWSGDRYSCYLDLPTYRRVLVAAGFEELEHYYRPTGQPRHAQPWLASVWQKVSVRST